MFNHPYWEKVSNLVSIYEALYTVLRIVDYVIVPTMPFVYELIRVMKQNLHALKAKEWVKNIITDRWDKTLKHHLHVVGNYSISQSLLKYIIFLLSHTNSKSLLWHIILIQDFNIDLKLVVIPSYSKLFMKYLENYLLLL